ncbi:MAG: zinc protease [Saprospiraceae bacterium]|jgi:zinc protease
MINNSILSLPPEIHSIDSVQIPEVTVYHVAEVVPVYELYKADSGVIMLEAIFYAGRPQESKFLTSSCCAPMMREGAGKYSSEELSEEIDYRGASISLMSSLDLITIRLVCLRKYYADMISLLGEIVSRPHFDKKELDLFIKRRVERLQIELAKNDIVSYRRLTESIYGSENPYGYNSSKDRYESLEVMDIVKHYEATIRRNNCLIFVCGDVHVDDKELLETFVHQIPAGGEKLNNLNLLPYQGTPSRMEVKGNPMQTSIKIGRKGLVRSHPDYYKLSFVNTLLGGFFGSRLVTNVRERLGLTYGIYSLMDNQLFDSCLMISTEVTNENVSRCLKEIYAEMERLKSDRVGEEELALVKNYLMGNYLNLFDGPFNSIKAIKSLVLSDIPLDKMSSIIQTSASLDSEGIMEMAQKYFNSEDYWEVIVGSPSL